MDATKMVFRRIEAIANEGGIISGRSFDHMKLAWIANKAVELCGRTGIGSDIAYRGDLKKIDGAIAEAAKELAETK